MFYTVLGGIQFFFCRDEANLLEKSIIFAKLNSRLVLAAIV